MVTRRVILAVVVGSALTHIAIAALLRPVAARRAAQSNGIGGDVAQAVLLSA